MYKSCEYFHHPFDIHKQHIISENNAKILQNLKNLFNISHKLQNVVYVDK